MSVPTFAGTVLPDCFVGVPYLAGLPIATVLSQNVTAVSVGPTTLGVPPAGLTFSGNGIVTGNVQVTSQTATQVDGAYTFLLKVTDGATQTASAQVTINVHYLPGGGVSGAADQSVAAQAAIRSGVLLENTSGTMAGASESGVFPTSPAVPTDIA